MKLPRAIRFDASDDHVFARAAGPDEWAVSGAFAFAGLAPEGLTGPTRQAFANGFLSLESFGRATFVAVAPVEQPRIDALADALACYLVESYGAPDMETARPAAREEIGFALDLCRDAPVNTLFAVSRAFDDEGRIREIFRTVSPPGAPEHARIWDVVEQ